MAVSGDKHGTLRVWRVRDGRTLHVLERAHKAWVVGVVDMGKGIFASHACDHHHLRLWDAALGELREEVDTGFGTVWSVVACWGLHEYASRASKSQLPSAHPSSHHAVGGGRPSGHSHRGGDPSGRSGGGSSHRSGGSHRISAGSSHRVSAGGSHRSGRHAHAPEHSGTPSRAARDSVALVGHESAAKGVSLTAEEEALRAAMRAERAAAVGGSERSAGGGLRGHSSRRASQDSNDEGGAAGGHGAHASAHHARPSAAHPSQHGGAQHHHAGGPSGAHSRTSALRSAQAADHHAVDVHEHNTAKHGREHEADFPPADPKADLEECHHVACGYLDGSIRVWNVKERYMFVRLVGHTDAVRALTLATSYSKTLPGQNHVWLASGSHDTTVRVWDVFDAEPCKLTFAGHSGWVVSVADVGGGLLVSSSVDGTVRVWDLFEKNCAFVLTGIHSASSAVWSVAPSRTHGGRFSTCGGDGTVRLWKWTEERQVVPVIESTKGEAAHHESRMTRVKVVQGARQSTHDKAVTAFVEELEKMDETKKAEMVQSAVAIQRAWRQQKVRKMAAALVETKAEEEEKKKAAAAAADAPGGAGQSRHSHSRSHGPMRHASAPKPMGSAPKKLLKDMHGEEKEHHAATKIQAAWKGRQARLVCGGRTALPPRHSTAPLPPRRSPPLNHPTPCPLRVRQVRKQVRVGSGIHADTAAAAVITDRAKMLTIAISPPPRKSASAAAAGAASGPRKSAAAVPAGTDEEHAAAVKIQAVWRGRKARAQREAAALVSCNSLHALAPPSSSDSPPLPGPALQPPQARKHAEGLRADQLMSPTSPSSPMSPTTAAYFAQREELQRRIAAMSPEELEAYKAAVMIQNVRGTVIIPLRAALFAARAGRPPVTCCGAPANNHPPQAWRRKRARMIMAQMREAFARSVSFDVAFGVEEMNPLGNPLLTSAANQSKGGLPSSLKRRSVEWKLVGHGGGVHALAQAMDSWLLSVSADMSVRKWDVERARPTLLGPALLPPPRPAAAPLPLEHAREHPSFFTRFPPRPATPQPAPRAPRRCGSATRPPSAASPPSSRAPAQCAGSSASSAARRSAC